MAENFTIQGGEDKFHTLNIFHVVTACLGILFLFLIVVCLCWIFFRFPWRQFIGRAPGYRRQLKVDKVSKLVKKSKLVTSDEDCSICLFSIDDGLSVEMICKHRFHKECIKSWIKMKKLFCPVCRESFEQV